MNLKGGQWLLLSKLKFEITFLILLSLVVGRRLIAPTLFSDGYFSMEKRVRRSQILWCFLIHYELSENNFFFVLGFWIDIEDVGTFNLPHSSYIHKPPTIRVEVGYSYDGYCHHYADSWNCCNLPSKFNPNIVTHS